MFECFEIYINLVTVLVVTALRELIKVEAVKRGHELKNPHMGSLPLAELTSEIFCCITH